MKDVLVDFKWNVAPGYSWVQLDPEKPLEPWEGEDESEVIPEYVVVPGSSRVWVERAYDPFDPDTLNKRYRPFKNTGLFQIFAETPITYNGIASFANRYGMLTREIQDFVEFRTRDIYEYPNTKRLELGERFSLWKMEILKMRRAISLWLLLKDIKDSVSRKRKVKEIYRNQVKRLANGMILILSEQKVWTIRSKTDPPELSMLPIDEVKFEKNRKAGSQEESMRFKEIILEMDGNKICSEKDLSSLDIEDILREAWNQLQITVNEQLERALTVKILSKSQDRWERGANRSIVPQNLLGALWLQFADAISGNKKYRRCRECNKPFEIGGDLKLGYNRNDRRTCSDTCRNRSYRRRKKARELRSAGLTIPHIAKQLGTEESKIRKWIKNKRS